MTQRLIPPAGRQPPNRLYRGQEQRNEKKIGEDGVPVMARRHTDDNTHGKREHEPQPPPPRTNMFAALIRALEPRFCVSQSGELTHLRLADDPHVDD
jgi:hypothetical protein